MCFIFSRDAIPLFWAVASGRCNHSFIFLSSLFCLYFFRSFFLFLSPLFTFCLLVKMLIERATNSVTIQEIMSVFVSFSFLFFSNHFPRLNPSLVSLLFDMWIRAAVASARKPSAHRFDNFTWNLAGTLLEVWFDDIRRVTAPSITWIFQPIWIRLNI